MGSAFGDYLLCRKYVVGQAKTKAREVWRRAAWQGKVRLRKYLDKRW